MRQQPFKWFLAAFFTVIFSLPFPTAQASVSATGEFTATQSCQAYQSMRRKTNPGAVQLEIGKTYPVSELNVPGSTTWYRLRVEGADPEQRWAYFECGTVTLNDQKEPSSEGQDDENQCETAGLADSFVFALSWQPAFCETHHDKPECSVNDSSSYQANNFTLHGLWPNKKACGTGYGFCGKYKREVSPFCNYDSVPMQAKTIQELGVVMPSASHGSCLQRHEWFKHGTCQTQWKADAYYQTAMRLLKDFNQSGMASFMQKNIGKTVSTESFFDAVDKAFSADAHLRLQISCSNGRLVDVYISLPAALPPDQSLGALMQQARPNFRNTCGSTFEVDAIGQ